MAVPVADSISLMFFLLRPHSGWWTESSSLKASTTRFSCGYVSLLGLIRRESMYYHAINVDEDAGFGVLRREIVTVDGNPPTLVSAELCITIQAIDNGSEFWPEKKDVYPTVSRYIVKRIRHGLFQGTSKEISNHVTVNVHSRAALQEISYNPGDDRLSRYPQERAGSRSGCCLDFCRRARVLRPSRP